MLLLLQQGNSIMLLSLTVVIHEALVTASPQIQKKNTKHYHKSYENIRSTVFEFPCSYESQYARIAMYYNDANINAIQSLS